MTEVTIIFRQQFLIVVTPDMLVSRLFYEVNFVKPLRMTIPLRDESGKMPDVFELINMNGRVYDPRIARFLSPDPLLQFPTYSQAFNRYSYCLNNPLKYTDPSGYSLEDGSRKPLSFQERGYTNITLESWFNDGWLSAASDRADAYYRSCFSYDFESNTYVNELGETVDYSLVFENYIAPNCIPLALPLFLDMIKNYPAGQTSEEVYKLIGGKVYQNYKGNPTAYANSCALRISRALNYSGAEIPFVKDQTGSGSDGKWYFYKIKDLKNYLTSTYGPPDLTGNEASMANQHGIILFQDCGWLDATGHIDLWDGNSCAHKCYWDQCGNASLWLLP
ncbi:MAG TPA: T6SS effector amidase Tae4 family protein [Bacteroidales bacterium]|nr:T6SS effector amidase Tae4 family protein [Bacteroidales bacterium]